MRSTAAVILILLLPACCAFGEPKFYPDDPLLYEPDPLDATYVQPWNIDLLYDLLENMFTHPGDQAENVRAQDINTIDEVPDSSWFTNRIGTIALTAEDVAKGPNVTDGPAPGKWTVISAKSDGVTPGFTIRDEKNLVWFLKFDPPGYRAMATGTEVVVTKLMWALGYFVPENHVARLVPRDLVISPGTLYKLPTGRKRPMKQGDVNHLLDLAQRDPDGSYRVIASLALPGKVLGGFRFYGTRPDDPNDVIPHEHRRELRGYRVFAAWFNHVDSKAINSLDTLVTEDKKIFVRHNLLDFGSTLGSGALFPREPWEGYEYLFEDPHQIGRDLISVGFRIEPWRTLPMYQSRSIGRLTLDNTKWDPEGWLPRVPNAAFLRARADDKFWAARKAMAITDDMIRAAVKTGEFGDSRSEDFLTKALIDRRNAIGKRYLPAINPIVNLQLDGTLKFANAAVSAGVASSPESYEADWYRFSNETGETQSLGSTTATTPELPAPAGIPTEEGAFIKVHVKATHKDFPAWQQPVTAYFRETATGWKLVGFDRLDDSNTAATASIQN